MTTYTTTQKGEQFIFICEWTATKNGFKHICEIHGESGYPLASATIKYINRTWEKYEYQTAIYHAIDNLKLSNDKQENTALKTRLKKQIDNKKHY